LYKAYFEKGYSLTNYVKYVIALFGLTSLNLKLTMIFAGIYALSCFVIGWAWYHYGLIYAEMEVSNRFNLFVKEMRDRF
jgi:hypothetical protein